MSSLHLPAPEGHGSASGARTFRPASPTPSPATTLTLADCACTPSPAAQGPPRCCRPAPDVVRVAPGDARADRDVRVVAVGPRGAGRSDKPRDAYETGTPARDMVTLMDALGHRRFAMAGHDVGMWTGYALAADRPDRLDRLAVAVATIPGLSPTPPLFGSRAGQRPPLALRVQPPRRHQRGAGPRARTPLLRAPVRRRRPRSRCPTTPFGTTSTLSPPPSMPCDAASRSTFDLGQCAALQGGGEGHLRTALTRTIGTGPQYSAQLTGAAVARCTAARRRVVLRRSFRRSRSAGTW